MTVIWSDGRHHGCHVSIGQMLLGAPMPAGVDATSNTIVRVADDDPSTWAAEKGLSSQYYWRRREEECPRDSDLWRDYMDLWRLALEDGMAWNVVGGRPVVAAEVVG